MILEIGLLQMEDFEIKTKTIQEPKKHIDNISTTTLEMNLKNTLMAF
jgi:hypothetical protein